MNWKTKGLFVWLWWGDSEGSLWPSHSISCLVNKKMTSELDKHRRFGQHHMKVERFNMWNSFRSVLTNTPLFVNLCSSSFSQSYLRLPPLNQGFIHFSSFMPLLDRFDQVISIEIEWQLNSILKQHFLNFCNKNYIICKKWIELFSLAYKYTSVYCCLQHSFFFI